MAKEEIKVMPFDWNDNLSEIAQEDFSLIRKNLSYGTASSIGMALAKLELLEKQGCKVEPKAEQKAVLVKIRAEIENHCGLIKEDHCKYCGYCNSVMGVREILEIIDKYKAESEGEE